MRHLLPGGVEEPLDELYADLTFPAPGDDRPYVFLGMVSSLDGAATIDGESAGLGGRGDLQAFRRLRAAADAVLVGAGTVRTEDYRGVALPDEVRRARADLGREEVPPIVVVTRSVDLDPGSALFHDTRRRPWLLVPGDTDERRLLPFREIAEVVRAGTDDVDLGQGLRRLRRL
ncbi:MAG TPA: dihydrofolate reductase family protein, partial [Nitriliruptorales bacterium]